MIGFLFRGGANRGGECVGAGFSGLGSQGRLIRRGASRWAAKLLMVLLSYNLGALGTSTVHISLQNDEPALGAHADSLLGGSSSSLATLNDRPSDPTLDDSNLVPLRRSGRRLLSLYLGSFKVKDSTERLSPGAGIYPNAYTCQEACLMLFQAANPAMVSWEGSISSTTNTRTCHIDTFSVDCNAGPVADTYKLQATYSSAGATSAYVNDHGCQQ
eukprot:5617584-Pyramimonas_sp.AAC.1